MLECVFIFSFVNCCYSIPVLIFYFLQMSKRNLKTLSLDEKIRLIKEVDKRKKKKNVIALEFGIPPNTLTVTLFIFTFIFTLSIYLCLFTNLDAILQYCQLRIIKYLLGPESVYCLLYTSRCV